MKTIRGTKVFLMVLPILLSTASCVPSSSKSTAPNANTATVTSNDSSSNATANTQSSSSSVSGTSATPQTGDVTFYGSPDPTPTLPGVTYNSCGILYKQLNNDNTFFRDNNGADTLIVQQYSYDSALILDQVKSINDTAASAYNTCLTGYIKSGIIFLDSATQRTATNNPTHTNKASYSYEYCGLIAHTTYSSNNWTLLKMANKDFIVKNKMGRGYSSNIPTVGKTISSQNAVEACIYSNKAEYKDYGTSFYHVIDAAVIDLGALN